MKNTRWLTHLVFFTRFFLSFFGEYLSIPLRGSQHIAPLSIFFPGLCELIPITKGLARLEYGSGIPGARMVFATSMIATKIEEISKAIQIVEFAVLSPFPLPITFLGPGLVNGTNLQTLVVIVRQDFS